MTTSVDVWPLRVRSSTTVLVWKFDRFARSTKQLIDALEEFRSLGVDFISITEQIDTSSPMGKAMFTMISAIVEFERSLIVERVRAGIAKSRSQGKRYGRPKTEEKPRGKSGTSEAKQEFPADRQAGWRLTPNHCELLIMRTLLDPDPESSLGSGPQKDPKNAAGTERWIR